MQTKEVMIMMEIVVSVINNACWNASLSFSSLHQGPRGILSPRSLTDFSTEEEVCLCCEKQLPLRTWRNFSGGAGCDDQRPTSFRCAGSLRVGAV